VAERRQPLGLIPRGWWWPPLLATALLLLIVGGALLALVWQASRIDPGQLLGDPYLRWVLLFTLGQALLCSALCVTLALPLARALHRRDFPGKPLLLRLCGLTMVLPVMVVVFGLVQVHGNQGWVNQVLQGIGAGRRPYLYGLFGILLGHLFLNLPFATRVLYDQLQSIPDSSWRLAQQLGLRSAQCLRLVEWPALKPQLLPLAGLVFMLCFSSFAVVLALGGGPRYATLEVAIYQAIKFDFDLGRAVSLCLWQLCLTALFALLMQQGAPQVKQAYRPVSGPSLRPDRHQPLGRWLDRLWLLLLGLLLLPPLLAVLLRGCAPAGWVQLDYGRLFNALRLSLGIGSGAALLAVAMALALLAGIRTLRLQLQRPGLASLLEALAHLILVVPALALGTGLFVLLHRHLNVFAHGAWLVALINALMALPFVLRLLSPTMHQSLLRYHKLNLSLGIRGWALWRLVEWPQLRRPLASAFAIALLLSIGDLGVIALFGSNRLQTLPLLLYQLLGSYQMAQAGVVALLLLLLALAVYTLSEQLLTRRQDA